MLHDAEDFLEVVYGDREGWIDLPAKVAGHWVPFHTEWPSEAGVTRRIDSSLRDGEDLYYSVGMFRSRGRRVEDVLPLSWLWADLDEVHPSVAAGLGFMPTVAIESSPGRYQALWKLTRELKASTLEKLNRGLSYTLDADRGGWDLTQVLRIPFTRNFKYPGAPLVGLLWYKEELTYDPQRVWASVKAALGPELTAATSVDIPRRGIPAKARALLRTPPEEVVTGERSARLWELSCLLIESGLSEDEVFDLAWGSAWNKWRAVHTGRSRLARDIRKAAGHVRRQRALAPREAPERKPSKPAPSGDVHEDKDEDKQAEGIGSATDRLPFVGYSSFMAMQFSAPRWLVQDVWVNGSVGLIAGEPKTSKTTLALSLAMAVASGRPMMGEGQWGVGVEGPVIMVQEENAPWMMQDRMRKLAVLMGLLSASEAHVTALGEVEGAGALGTQSVELDFPFDLPLKLLNNYGFDLAVEEHRDMLWAEVEAVRPVLVVLDPLYLLLGGANENQSSELRPFLKWMLALRYEFDCAIAVVHHMRKQQKDGAVVRAGQRVMGNATLHGWVDSALYSSALDEARVGWTGIRVEREFRSMAPQRPWDMRWCMHEPGSLQIDLEVEGFDLQAVLKDIVSDRPGITITELAKMLDRDKRTILSRVRGHEELTVKSGKQGRGYSHRAYPQRNGAGE